MKLNTIRDANFAGKRVLLRVDFNVPLKDGQVSDDTRIRAAMPTIVQLLKGGARLVICSHLGRPKGGPTPEFRLDPIVPVLSQRLNMLAQELGMQPFNIVKLDEVVGEKVKQAIAAGGPQDVFLLENTRFEPGEEKNDPELCKQFAELADAFVSDAFGTVHRAHATTEGVAHLLPSYAGLLLEKEVTGLAKIIADPQRPLVVILGGAKISGKIEVLDFLLPLADSVLIGGAMANTFLKAQGLPTGQSLVEDEMVGTAARLLEDAKQHGTEFLLPLDYIVTDNLQNPRGQGAVDANGIGELDIAVDIGKRTREAYRRVIERARTVFWNGPMGVFETPQFAEGTLFIAQALADVYNTAHTVVGGGESVAAVNQAKLANRIHHVSTGGGASLEFVAGLKLPGIEVLAVK
jgi:phosphoglycerate kinase